MSIWIAIRRWWDNQDALDILRDDYTILVDVHLMGQREREKLQFLLNQAPMMDFPAERERVMAARSSYAYINPATLPPYLTPVGQPDCVVYPGMPTVWVLTTMIPPGRVIFSPNRIPYLGK